MRIFITGEAGMTAQYLEQKLVQQGHDVVWGLYHRNDVMCSRSTRWGVKELDILGHTFLATVEKKRPDVIVHCAACVGTDLCQQSPADAIHTNIFGTQKVVEAAKAVGAKLVYFSTTAIFDPNSYGVDNPITTFTPRAPKTLYGMTKYIGELVASTQLPYCNLLILRPCFMFGGKLDTHSAISKIVQAIVANKNLEILMDPKNLKDYIYIDDAVQIIVNLIGNNVAGQFHVSRGSARSFQEYVAEIESIMGSKATITFRPEEDYLHNHIVDGEDALLAAKYRPTVRFEDAVRQIWKEYADR